jgi:hypothetical protein
MFTDGGSMSRCGTSSIYVDRINGKLRISYAMHSIVGNITSRILDVNWGPTSAGSNHDVGLWNRRTFNNALSRGPAKAGDRAGATLRWQVTTSGWTLACWVSADEPVHRLP